MTRRLAGAGAIALAAALAGCGGQTQPQPAATRTAPQQAPAATAAATPARKEYDFRGEVKSVDASSGKITVANDSIEGWMNAMTMTYGVDHREVLPTIKPGDRIRAHVYDGDYQTLYDVRLIVAPPKLP
ncbi:MAG TPA: copper-binding protein [Vicinamibacterales bacterium]|nr:copper-binding protein [Vicinamibacterales bacterium]